jgi:hypothetical protein
VPGCRLNEIFKAKYGKNLVKNQGKNNLYKQFLKNKRQIPNLSDCWRINSNSQALLFNMNIVNFKNGELL